MKYVVLLLTFAFSLNLGAQDKMTPEMLWQLGRVGAVGITKDGKSVVYRVTRYNIEENKSSSKLYMIPIKGGEAVEVDNSDNVANNDISSDGKNEIYVKDVKIMDVYGKDFYPEMTQSEVMIYEDLNYRHWDKWEDGAYSHVFVRPAGSKEDGTDIMANEPYDCPQQPFGGGEDYIWSPDGQSILYVTKKKVGREYTVSTNTDIYAYNLQSKQTTNLTEGRMGFDTHPEFSSSGSLAWLSMKRDGYESDKNDLIVKGEDEVTNLTEDWDGTVFGFEWSTEGDKIYFNAPIGGTVQLFEVPVNSNGKKGEVKQITDGQWDVRGIVGQSGNTLVVYRSDMNHATELYTVNLKNGEMTQLTTVNNDVYDKIKMSKVEKRIIETTDGKDMVSWVIYPPDFDPNKKYPTLLYCQGGPQSALSQFYSFRWNFQLMAANGYIVVAPNRRGMPGHGVEWNEAISTDYGGLCMQDYLNAIDAVAKEPYVDNNKLGCVGASFGGYSVFYLAGIHKKRFKSFIAHDGLFNLHSMYGTTEEMWFVNWDFGGAYWDKKNEAAQVTYSQFNPINFVNDWDTPILIIQGGKDFRVPIGQALEAFQAAQLKGIKSKLLYFPNENHWVLKAQNGVIWHREFYKWLGETLK